MSPGSVFIGKNGYLQQEFSVNDKLLKATFGLMEYCDAPGVHRYWRTLYQLKAIINKPHWVFTENIGMNCKKVSIEVQWR